MDASTAAAAGSLSHAANAAAAGDEVAPDSNSDIGVGGDSATTTSGTRGAPALRAALATPSLRHAFQRPRTAHADAV